MCFSRAAVAVEIPCLGIASRPACGLKVLHKEELTSHDAADRVTPVVWAADVVAFHADQHMVADCGRAARLPEDIAEAAPDERPHSAIAPGQAGGVQNRRGQVDKAYVVVHDAAR